MRGRRLTALLCGILISLLVAPAAPQSTSANRELDLGVQAYKNARYEEAIQHFERAAALEPSSIPAHMYLATAYAQQFIPGAEGSENTKYGQLAIEHYKRVTELDPTNVNALKGLAYLHLQMKKFEVAKEYYRAAAQVDAKDAETYYSIAVIDWTQTYQPRMELRAKLGLKPEHSLIHIPECWQVRDANREKVSEGIEMLKKAIELRRDYDDAMAYMNLMYRERADIQCDDAKANAADLKTADDWVDLTLATKKRKAEAEERQAPKPADTPQ